MIVIFVYTLIYIQGILFYYLLLIFILNAKLLLYLESGSVIRLNFQ
jgi:hypothetical protein